MENTVGPKTNETPMANASNCNVIDKEITRIKKLREDVLLLRFHLARRTDIKELIDNTDRLLTESALKSSLEVLEAYDRQKETPSGHIAAAASALMYAVDTLVSASRMAEEKDGTDEIPMPITPESLRASLPLKDIEKALGLEETKKKKAMKSESRKFLFRTIRWAFLAFVLALLIQVIINLSGPITSDKGIITGIKLIHYGDLFSKDFIIPIAGFFWAMVGSYVWILIRFRRFGAAYAFNPAHAQVYHARVVSSAITSAILLYFVFGGIEPWAKNWRIDLPLWAFVFGYAGRLQVELLRKMVERIEQAITQLKTKEEKKPEISKKTVSNSADQQQKKTTKPPPVDPDNSGKKTPRGSGSKNKK